MFLKQQTTKKTTKILTLILISTVFLIHPSLQIRNMTIFGNATLGYYYLEAYVGTPGQKQAMILDTGSNLTIFPCKGCQKCRDHVNSNFDPNKSSTFEKINKDSDFLGWKCKFFNDSKKECAFNQGYTEGSAYIGKNKDL